MKKSLMVLAIIYTVLLCACSASRYNSNGVGCYVSYKENPDKETVEDKKGNVYQVLKNESIIICSAK